VKKTPERQKKKAERAVLEPIFSLFLKATSQGKVKDHVGRRAQEIFCDPEIQGYIFRKS
jgi:hypothetical protein